MSQIILIRDCVMFVYTMYLNFIVLRWLCCLKVINKEDFFVNHMLVYF